MSLLPKIFLTIAALQFGVVPPIIDLTETHVFHGDWPGHARFHMVWLLAIGSSIAAYIVWLVWKNGPAPIVRLKHASVLGCLVLAGFFTAYALMPQYGGLISDPEHNIKVIGMDGNVLSFSIASVFQLLGTVLIWRRSSTAV